nr:MAG TPA: hypothetical protein [Caudoviricetes sp.]
MIYKQFPLPSAPLFYEKTLFIHVNKESFS